MADLKLNEKHIKFSGAGTVPPEAKIKLDGSYKAVVNFTIVKGSECRSNQDGTFDEWSTGKILSIEDINEA